MRLILSAILTLLLTACAVPTALPEPTPTPMPPTNTPAPTLEPAVDAFTMNRQLARTVNLGNALEAPSEGEWGMTLQAEYFQLIKQAGFTAVRVPIRWSAHAEANAPYTIDPAFFERVDWVIAQARQNDLTVLINMHHYEEMATDPRNHQVRFIALWKQIAERYQSQPQAVLFELMNEPNGQLNASLWNKILAETLPVVRASNPIRNLVLGPAEWNNLRALKELKLPADDAHLIVTFHYYDPFQFTHQGAEWVQGADAWLGTTWSATSAQKQSVTFDLDRVAEWSQANNRPIFMGEFGAYSKADLESRQIWTDFVAREAEKRGFSWSYWEFGAGFGVYNREAQTWNEELLRALIP